MARFPELVGKTAIVTGGGVGIGEAIARALAATGVHVAVVSRQNREAAECVASDLRGQGTQSFALLADVSQPDEVDRMVADVTAKLGKVDILVNNAGGFKAPKPVFELTYRDWDEVMAINLRSCFLCTRAVLPQMIERRWGRIINVASEAGRMPRTASVASYAAAKAGMIGFTKHSALEVGAYGVTVNATSPSTTYSPRVRGNLVRDRATVERFESMVPLGRIGEPAEQAGIVVFLASNEASYINGATIDVTGGKVMI